MNMNPWFMERMAEYERDRIQRDMKQIRLEKEALPASRAEENIAKIRFDRPYLLMQIVPAFVRSMLCLGK